MFSLPLAKNEKRPHRKGLNLKLTRMDRSPPSHFFSASYMHAAHLVSTR
ncbi:hypothetical protein NIES4073_81100 [Kalymmatonema gypsitolerans NIES-4073]|nr:hypothetical protein NIES4073_81100 [Scytonema sp. NIES-4073]